jgi:hypothetical protein
MSGLLKGVQQTSGTSFFPLDTETDREPRHKSTAYAEGVLYNPATNQGIPDAVGKFSLWFEGEVIISERAMTNQPDQDDGWVRCLILHTELAQQGLYQWEMVITDDSGTLVLTDNGDFTI